MGKTLVPAQSVIYDNSKIIIHSFAAPAIYKAVFTVPADCFHDVFTDIVGCGSRFNICLRFILSAA